MAGNIDKYVCFISLSSCNLIVYKICIGDAILSRIIIMLFAFKLCTEDYYKLMLVILTGCEKYLYSHLPFG